MSAANVSRPSASESADDGVRGRSPRVERMSAPADTNIVWHPGLVSRHERAVALGGAGMTVWLTGLSGAGKSTVAFEVEKWLLAAGRPVYVLDGDNVRHGLNGDLGFSAADRTENVRRVAHVARLMADAGVVALVPLISPYRVDRDAARAIHDAAGIPFAEVYVDTPIALCEERDPKGLYKKARAGEIKGFTGIDDPYEAPTSPELRLVPTDGGPTAMAERVLEMISLSTVPEEG